MSEVVPDKSASYNASDPLQETMEKATKRLTGDIRQKVRRITAVSLYTHEWMEQTELFDQLAFSALREEHDSMDAPQKESTVWERDEPCIRIIVEEGKVNLIMRSLAEFKANSAAIRECTGELSAAINSYERSVGIILRCCVTAIEALQIMDIRAFLDYISATLDNALSPGFVPSEDFISKQEAVVIHYVSSIMRGLEKLNEDVVMGKVLSLGIVKKCIQHMSLFFPRYDRSLRHATVLLFSALMECETYKTKPSAFIPTNDDKKAIVAILEPVAKALVTEFPDRKKLIRPLLDAFIRFK